MARRPYVTDHAVLRYIERVMGYDVEGVRNQIAIETFEAVNLGASALKSRGTTFVMSGETVVTCYTTRREKGPRDD